MAWTITATIDEVYGVCHPMGYEMVVVKLDCISDASGTDTDLKTVMEASEKGSFGRILGGWQYGCKVVPGTGDDVPSGTFSIDFQDADNFSWIDENDLAVDAVDWISGADEADGQYGIVEKTCSFVSTTLGDANTAVFYLYVLKG